MVLNTPIFTSTQKISEKSRNSPPPPSPNPVTYHILIKLKLARSLFVKNSYTEIHVTLTNSLAAVTRHKAFLALLRKECLNSSMHRPLKTQPKRKSVCPFRCRRPPPGPPPTPSRSSQSLCSPRRWAPHGAQRVFFYYY
jgi:hypothetical protein